MPQDFFPAARRFGGLSSTANLRIMWRTMSWRSRVHLLVAIGMTFGLMGFVIDLMNLADRLPWSEVIAYAAFTALVTMLMMMTIMTVPKMAGKIPPSVLASRGSVLRTDHRFVK